MPRSPQLQKQISVMDRISRAMAELDGDDRATGRVVSWFMDEYIPDDQPAAGQHQAAPSGSKESAT